MRHECTGRGWNLHNLGLLESSCCGMCNLLGNDNVAFFLGSLCHADPTFAGWRNVALWRFSLTFGHEEGIRQFLLYKSPVIWEEWELFSCPDPAVMSGLDRAVYLIPPRLDLPENKLRPPRSCCSMKSVCSCELLPRLDCPHKQLRLWSQRGKPVLSCRQKTINWFKLGRGGAGAMGEDPY